MLQRTRPMCLRANVYKIQHRQDEDCSAKNELQHGVLLFSDAVHTMRYRNPNTSGQPSREREQDQN